MICEKCWSDAGGDAMRYAELVNERTMTGYVCSKQEQCGELHVVSPITGKCACGLRSTPQPEGARDG